MPAGEKGIIKAVESGDDKGRVEFALAGEHAVLILNGVEMNKINKGSVICDLDSPIRSVTRLQARLFCFRYLLLFGCDLSLFQLLLLLKCRVILR